MISANRHRVARLFGIIAALIIIAIAVHFVRATMPITLHVDSTSPCTNTCVNTCGADCPSGCGDLSLPYRTIQDAINDANCRIINGTATGATVEVAAGTYLERIFIYPNVHIRCQDPSTTTIDASGFGRSAVIFASGGTGRALTDFSIDGCTITGGTGEVRPLEETVAGGGVFIFGDAVVSNNEITGNVLSGSEDNWLGAGIYVAYGDPTIAGNIITRNTADPPPVGGQASSFAVGGGIFSLGPIAGINTHVRIEDNYIAHNFVGGEIGRGAGLRVDGNPGTVITRNVIIGNRASYGGGGLEIYGTALVADNLVYGNSSEMFGGGMNIFQATAQVTNNTIVGNRTTGTELPTGYTYAAYGGGMSVDTLFSQAADPQVQITNTLIVGNSVSGTGYGGGLFTYLTFPIVTYTDIWSNTHVPDVPDDARGDHDDADILAMSGNVMIDPILNHRPLFTDTVMAPGTTTTVIVQNVTLHVVNQIIEYDDDGLPRTITAVDPGTSTLTFTPALAAPSENGRLVANWDTGTDTLEDLQARMGSPVVDAGTNLGVSTTDLVGAPRIVDGDEDESPVADMGAYELIPPDTDGDGVSDGLDCAPTVNSVWMPPGPVGETVALDQGEPVPVVWDDIPQANVFNVYRGTIDGAFTYNQTCHESASPDRLSEDASLPPLNAIHFYLITGVSRCAEGSAGTDAAGSERPNPAPCAIVSADADGDGVDDLDDNCPLAGNTAQADIDADGAGDACDNCIDAPNPDQSDADDDGVGNHCQDDDLDGSPVAFDCNDTDPAINPDAPELCDFVDNNCDGLIDEGFDLDGDGYTTCGGDCDDTDPTINPDGTEICDLLDNDCDGFFDEPDAVDALTWYRDTDGDGFGDPASSIPACSRPPGFVGNDQDCNDTDPAINPSITETCDLIDNNCDGLIDEGFDGDGDGFTTCGGDCNDADPAINPGATEVCDGIDDNCDGLADDGFPDTDGDTLADCVDADDDNDLVPDVSDCAPLTNSVSTPPGEVGDTVAPVTGAAPGTYTWVPVAQANVHNVYKGTIQGDAGSSLASVTCHESESPDRFTEDSTTPAIDTIDFYVITGTNGCDEGGAGRGSDGSVRVLPVVCQPQGRDTDLDLVGDIADDCPLVANGTQADADLDGRGDACDNCIATPNAGQEDGDADGTGDVCQDDDADGFTFDQDCNDQDPLVNPDAIEVCDTIDNDCDGIVDGPDAIGASTWYRDSDGDGFGDAVVTIISCFQPAGFVADSQDCNDADPVINPDATEGPFGDPTCADALDNDCDGTVDDLDQDCAEIIPCPDADSDGAADCTTDPTCDSTGLTCGDCDDADPGVLPGAAESCNGIDDNCDGAIDDGFLDTDADGLADCIDPDDDNDTIPDTSDNCPLDANTSQDDLDGDLLGDVCDDDADGDGFSQTGGPGAESLTTGESTVSGTITGTHLDTHVSDDQYEVIEEIVTGGGNPSRQRSEMEHSWTIQVNGENSLVFSLEAHHSPNTEGDDIRFSYSTDGINFDQMFILTKTADDDTPMTFVLPSGILGTLTILAEDTDRTQGNNGLDSLFIDYMAVVAGPGVDCNDLDDTVFPGAVEICDGVDNNCNGEIDEGC